MYLRSGPDWHLDTAGEHTFAAYFEDRGLSRDENDPVPIGVFLDHTDWFRAQKGFDVDERHVDVLEADPDRNPASSPTRGGQHATITAEKVLAAPASATSPPSGVARGRAAHRRAHTSDLVDFDAWRAPGWSSWAAGKRLRVDALLCDHGAASVDVVHRHPAPAFERVRWDFVNPYVEQTLARRGWWRRLSADEQRAIALEFWQVGRLTLEPWLPPPSEPDVVTVHASCEVVEVEEGDEATVWA